MIINLLVLELNSKCKMENHRFKLQDLISSCKRLTKKKKKAGGENPNRDVQERPQLAAHMLFFRNGTLHPDAAYVSFSIERLINNGTRYY
jgi:hypothetical protein